MVELFAGVGGFRIAAEKHGVKTLLWNQWEPSTKTTQHAQDVYLKNFGNEGYWPTLSVSNIADVSDAIVAEPRLKHPTFLVGGFPCQDYSVAKSATSALGLEGKKGVLWWEIYKLAAGLAPDVVFLENVDRLLKSPTANRGRDFAIMLASLGKLGYSVEWRVITASDYGSFQRRKRTYIVARKTLSNTNEVDYPVVAETLLSKGDFARAFPVVGLKGEPSTFDLPSDPVLVSESYHSVRGQSAFLDAGVYHSGKVLTGSLIPLKEPPRTLREVLLDYQDRDLVIPAEFYVDESQLEAWRRLKLGGSRERTSASGFKYLYSEGAMSFPDEIDRPARTILTGEGGSTPSRFKHVVLGANGQLRRLVPEELELLNGFPQGWTSEGINGPQKDAKRAFFMGNALVVDVVERIFREVIARGFPGNDSK